MCVLIIDDQEIRQIVKLKKISRKNRVFEEIRSFSGAEFRAFLAFLGPDREDRNYKKLITAMRGLRSVDQLDGLGWDSNALKNACNYILKRIIQFKAEQNQEDKYKFAEIRLSIELGMLSHARKLLLSAFKEAYATESMGILRELYEIEKRLRVHHGFEVIRNGEFLSASEFGKEFRLMMKAEAFRDREREYLRPRYRQLRDYSETLRTEIEEFGYDFRLVRPRVEALKVIRGWYIMKEEDSMVAKKQELVLELMIKNEALWDDQELVWEHCFYAAFLLNAKKYDTALKIIEDLEEKWVVSSLTPKRLILHWIVVNIGAISRGLRLGKGEQMEVLMLQYLEAIDAGMRPEFFHALSIAYAYEEKWEKVLQWQNRVSRSQQRFRNTFSWIPPLLKGIAYLELGDRDNAAAQLESLQESAKILKSDFIDLSYAVFAQSVDAEWGDPIPAKRLQGWREELSRLGKLKEHFDNSLHLNIVSWIASRETGKPIVEIVKAGGDELYTG